MSCRKGPNILVTGTPGTGKTCTCAAISEATGLRHINVGDVVKMEQCHQGKDDEFDSLILDEEKLLDSLTETLEEGNCVIDFHSCDFFPPEWIDLILVLRASTNNIFDRLTERNYSKRKRDENIECEIMQIVLEEAKETFPDSLIHELQSNTYEELEENVHRVELWLENWRRNNAE